MCRTPVHHMRKDRQAKSLHRGQAEQRWPIFFEKDTGFNHLTVRARPRHCPSVDERRPSQSFALGSEQALLCFHMDPEIRLIACPCRMSLTLFSPLPFLPRIGLNEDLA